MLDCHTFSSALLYLRNMFSCASYLAALTYLRLTSPFFRFDNIINLLGIPSPEAVELLLQEPRLLLPKSDVVTSNYHQLQKLLGVTGEELSSWVARAPELLLLSSDVVCKRLKLIPAILWQVSAKARAEHKVRWSGFYARVLG